MNLTSFRKTFSVKKPIIGMLHVFEGSRAYQLAATLEDLEKMKGIDGAIVENYGWGYAGPNLATRETQEALAEITKAVVNKAEIPIGVNVLPNDYEKAFQIAEAAGARFIQLDHVVGEFVGCSPVDPKHFSEIRSLYPQIAVLGGIHPKYYELENPLTLIEDSARRAMMIADAVVVTGEHTGGAAEMDDIRKVKAVIGDHPLVIGSGVSSMNAGIQLKVADGAIVGTAFKRLGVRRGQPVNSDLVRSFMEEVEKVRAGQV